MVPPSPPCDRSLGPECLNLVNAVHTEMFACLSDLVAKILYCYLATHLRVQVWIETDSLKKIKS